MVIVSGSDTNFVPGLLILIYSAWLHNPHAQFYVIDAGISPEGRDRLEAFCHRHGIRFGLLQADHDLLARLPKPVHWPRSVYARLMIPDLLPDHDRAIYIDSDALVAADLSDLWSLDLAGNLAAGSLDWMMSPKLLAEIGVGRDEYINTGVILMDLARWRVERISEQAIKLLLDRPTLDFPDQTAINLAAKGRITLLGREYNFLAREFTNFGRVMPRIIHYAGPDKPWWNRRAPLADVYGAYREASGADIPEPPRGWEFKTFRRTVLGLLALRPKYWRRLSYGRHYQARFVEPHVRALRKLAASRARS